MEFELSRGTFEPHVGSSFVVDGGTLGEIALVLDQVRSLGAGSGREEAFALEFVGPAEPILAQQTLAFRHAELGDVHVFVVPLGPDPAGTIRYEAIFT